tara:strand:- start:796 stop:1980 length:1185 start_codon:yes stop_codon:yes gene_type:complete
MHRIPVYLLLTCFWLNLSAQGVKTVEVAEAYKDRSRINLSSFAESIEYIQLETNDETLFSYPSVKGVHGDSVILLKSMNRIALFDRKTGGYLRDIGHRGEGPNSFSSPNGGLSFNTNNGNIFAIKYTKIVEFSTRSGEIVSTIEIPDLTKLGETNNGPISTQVNLNIWLNEGYMAGYIENLSGHEKMKLLLYDLQGNPLKLFMNNREFEKENPRHMRMNNVDLFSFNGQSYFKESFSDTLYSFNTTKMTPQFYFDTDKYKPEYPKQDLLTDKERSNIMFVDVITQDYTNLYFNMRYRNQYSVGLFNKQTNDTFISDPESDGLNGFYNDLDHFIPFIPKFRTNEGYLVGTISAEDMSIWFSENRSKANKLPQHLKQFRNIDPEDNPIVMIVKPKH